MSVQCNIREFTEYGLNQGIKRSQVILEHSIRLHTVRCMSCIYGMIKSANVRAEIDPITIIAGVCKRLHVIKLTLEIRANWNVILIKM